MNKAQMYFFYRCFRLVIRYVGGGYGTEYIDGYYNDLKNGVTWSSEE